MIPVGGKARSLLRHLYAAHKTQPLLAQGPRGAVAALKWHRSCHITSTHQLLPDPCLCCHYQGSQNPIPTCLPSSHFPFLVENLSLPDIGQAENISTAST